MRNLYSDNPMISKRLKTDKLFADYENEYRYTGFVDDAFNYVCEKQLLDEALWERITNLFGRDSDYENFWRCEYFGKVMRGGAHVFSYTKNPELYRVLKNAVISVIERQDELGRISTYPIRSEFTAWDLWGRKYVLLGMQYFYEICKEEEIRLRIKDSMMRQVDYIMTKIGSKDDGKTPVVEASRHFRGVNSASILEPVVRLYNLTNEQRYLDFAAHIVECGATSVGNLFTLAEKNEMAPYQYPITKAYETTSCFEGLLEFYRATGDERHKRAVINFAKRILETDFTVVGGCGTSSELFDHSTVRQANRLELPSQETCVTVSLMKLFFQLNLLTAEPEFADAFETSFYNVYLGAYNTNQVVQKNMADVLNLMYLSNIQKKVSNEEYERIKAEKDFPKWNLFPLPFDSYSPLIAGCRGEATSGLLFFEDGYYYGCCNSYGPTGIGLVPKMQLLSKEDGFVLNLFINGEIKSKAPDGEDVIFKIKTDYPVSGEVDIEVVTKSKNPFTLSIRNPAFSKTTKISLDGCELSVCEGYNDITSVFEGTRNIHVSLDMRTKAILPIPYGSQIVMTDIIWEHNYTAPKFDKEDEDAHRHIALRRGPIVFAQDARLGYSLDTPVDIAVGADGYVDLEILNKEEAPYKCIIYANAPLTNGKKLALTDYSSAGKTLSEESKMAAWFLTE